MEWNIQSVKEAPANFSLKSEEVETFSDKQELRKGVACKSILQ